MSSRHKDFTSIKVSGFQEAVKDILRSYGQVVYIATEEGLAAAEKVLVKNLKNASPRKTGEFMRAWKGTGRKYKMVRYVGNTKTVDGKEGPIALANVIEYSTTHGKPFIKDTFNSSIDEMAAAVVAEIMKEA